MSAHCHSEPCSYSLNPFRGCLRVLGRKRSFWAMRDEKHRLLCALCARWILVSALSWRKLLYLGYIALKLSPKLFVERFLGLNASSHSPLHFPPPRLLSPNLSSLSFILILSLHLYSPLKPRSISFWYKCMNSAGNFWKQKVERYTKGHGKDPKERTQGVFLRVVLASVLPVNWPNRSIPMMKCLREDWAHSYS